MLESRNSSAGFTNTKTSFFCALKLHFLYFTIQNDGKYKMSCLSVATFLWVTTLDVSIYETYNHRRQPKSFCPQRPAFLAEIYSYIWSNSKSCFTKLINVSFDPTSLIRAHKHYYFDERTVRFLQFIIQNNKYM